MTATALHRPVVLHATCDEPEGRMVRSVYPLDLSIENLRTFWEKAKQFDHLFTKEIREDFTKFINMLIKQGPDGITSTGLFWVIDDFVGVFYLTDIQPEVDALVHYTFFDGRHRGRELLVKEMLKYIFTRYKFQRLTAEAPLYATPQLFKFAEKIGFVKEGRRRSSVPFDGDWFDMNLYGILREEVFGGS